MSNLADHLAEQDQITAACEAREGNQDNEYAFDVKLFATIRVKAATIAQARAMLREHIETADCTFGAWPDGTPILGEASVDDDELPCVEVNGEAF